MTEASKPICFYHNADFDGLCSAAIVHRHVPGVELAGINYGDAFDFERVRGRKVYMVDYSLQPWSEMQRLFEVARGTIWIDHHKSAIEEYMRRGVGVAGGGLSAIIPTPIGEKIAACLLTWQYFCSGCAPSDALFWLSKYDAWDDRDAFRWENLILPFQFGLRVEEDTRPMSPLWDRLLSDDASFVGAIVERGKAILQYQATQNEKLMAACAFEASFGELRALVINAPLANSRTFSSRWDPAKHDVMISYFRRPSGNFTVSLYSDKPGVDCGAEAKKRGGGGGHKGAAGFQCNYPPWIEQP